MHLVEKARGMQLKRRQDVNLIACFPMFQRLDDFILPCFEVLYVIEVNKYMGG